jgi:hypothetical protein
VAVAELALVCAYGEPLVGTGKPMVAAGSIGSAGDSGAPATEEGLALPPDGWWITLDRPYLGHTLPGNEIGG